MTTKQDSKIFDSNKFLLSVFLFFSSYSVKIHVKKHKKLSWQQNKIVKCLLTSFFYQF